MNLDKLLTETAWYGHTETAAVIKRAMEVAV